MSIVPAARIFTDSGVVEEAICRNRLERVLANVKCDGRATTKPATRWPQLQRGGPTKRSWHVQPSREHRGWEKPLATGGATHGDA